MILLSILFSFFLLRYLILFRPYAIKSFSLYFYLYLSSYLSYSSHANPWLDLFYFSYSYKYWFSGAKKTKQKKSTVCLLICQPQIRNCALSLSCCSPAGSFRYSCDICGKKYKYYSCFQEHRDLHAVDGNPEVFFFFWQFAWHFFLFWKLITSEFIYFFYKWSCHFTLPCWCRISSACTDNKNYNYDK